MMTQLPDAGSLLEEVEPGLHYALISVGCQLSYDEVFHSLLGESRPMFMINVNGMKERHVGYYPFPLGLVMNPVDSERDSGRKPNGIPVRR
jgi:hypothetical protein